MTTMSSAFVIAMPRSLLRASIIAALCAALMLLSGCSAIRLAYGQADALAFRWLDRYAEFDDAQALRVREALTAWFSWHRRTQLPDYADLLASLEADVLTDTTAERVCAVWGVRAAVSIGARAGDAGDRRDRDDAEAGPVHVDRRALCAVERGVSRRLHAGGSEAGQGNGQRTASRGRMAVRRPRPVAARTPGAVRRRLAVRPATRLRRASPTSAGRVADIVRRVADGSMHDRRRQPRSAVCCSGSTISRARFIGRTSSGSCSTPAGWPPICTTARRRRSADGVQKRAAGPPTCALALEVSG